MIYDMTKLSPQQTRESSTNALKMVYYVIIGLAITEALYRTFLKDGSFLGLWVFRTKNLSSTLLLFALMPTICRFVHGASIHLDMISAKRYKPFCDFVGFFFQASFFYLMALSLEKQVIFSLFFGLMLLCDASWLLILSKIKYIELGQVEKQWLRSDFGIIGVLIVLLIGTKIEYIKIIDTEIVSICSAAVIFIVAIVATVQDYCSNKDFYFPTSEGAISGKRE